METNTLPATQQRNITDQVLAKVNEFEGAGSMVIPGDYVPANALKSAWLILQNVKDRNGKSALEVCTKDSVANALFEMVTQGLNPMKKQGDFIIYGNQLQWQREYTGNIALAKRYGNLREIHANVIYEGDVFEYSIDHLTGRKTVTKHEQKLENIDNTKIRGAYAVSVFNDNTSDMEPMTMAQIRAAWNQGAAKGNSGAHTNFTDQMAKKSVINRACKIIFRESDDSAIITDREDTEVDQVSESSKATIRESASKKEISMDEAEVISSTPTPVTLTEEEDNDGTLKGPGF
ncbi:MAG: recombinase RecT [Bacteroidota bacterium]